MNYDICVWHPPTLIYVLNSYVKEIRFWNQYPPTFYAMSSKSAVFFSDGFPYKYIINTIGAHHTLPKNLKDSSSLNTVTEIIKKWEPPGCYSTYFITWWTLGRPSIKKEYIKTFDLTEGGGQFENLTIPQQK